MISLLVQRLTISVMGRNLVAGSGSKCRSGFGSGHGEASLLKIFRIRKCLGSGCKDKFQSGYVSKIFWLSWRGVLVVITD